MYINKRYIGNWVLVFHLVICHKLPFDSSLGFDSSLNGHVKDIFSWVYARRYAEFLSLNATRFMNPRSALSRINGPANVPATWGAIFPWFTVQIHLFQQPSQRGPFPAHPSSSNLYNDILALVGRWNWSHGMQTKGNSEVSQQERSAWKYWNRRWGLQSFAPKLFQDPFACPSLQREGYQNSRPVPRNAWNRNNPRPYSNVSSHWWPW